MNNNNRRLRRENYAVKRLLTKQCELVASAQATVEKYAAICERWEKLYDNAVKPATADEVEKDWPVLSRWVN